MSERRDSTQNKPCLAASCPEHDVSLPRLAASEECRKRLAEGYRKRLAELARNIVNFVREYLDERADNPWLAMDTEGVTKLLRALGHTAPEELRAAVEAVETRATGGNLGEGVPLTRLLRKLREEASQTLRHEADTLSESIKELGRERPRVPLASKILPEFGGGYDRSCFELLSLASEEPQPRLSKAIREVWQDPATFLAAHFGYRASNYTFFRAETGGKSRKEPSCFVYSPEWLRPFPDQPVDPDQGLSSKTKGLAALDRMPASRAAKDFRATSQGVQIRKYFLLGATGLPVGGEAGADSVIEERSFEEVLLRRTVYEYERQILLVPDGEMSFRVLELYAVLRRGAVVRKDGKLDCQTRQFLAGMGLIRPEDVNREQLRTTPRSYRMLTWLKDTVKDAGQPNDPYRRLRKREPFIAGLSQDRELRGLLKRWREDCEHPGEGSCFGHDGARTCSPGASACGRAKGDRICDELANNIIRQLLTDLGQRKYQADAVDESGMLFNVCGHAAVRRCLSGPVFPGVAFDSMNGQSATLDDKAILAAYLAAREEQFGDKSEEALDCCCLDRGLIAIPLFDVGDSRCFAYFSVVGVSENLRHVVRDKQDSGTAREFIAHFRYAAQALGMPIVLKYREIQFEKLINAKSLEVTAHDIARAGQVATTMVQTSRGGVPRAPSLLEIGVLRWIGMCSTALVTKNRSYQPAFDIASTRRSNGELELTTSIEAVARQVLREATFAAVVVSAVGRSHVLGLVDCSPAESPLEAFVCQMSSRMRIRVTPELESTEVWRSKTLIRSLGQAVFMSAFFGTMRHLLQLFSSDDYDTRRGLALQGQGWEAHIGKHTLYVLNLARPRPGVWPAPDGPVSSIITDREYEWGDMHAGCQAMQHQFAADRELCRSNVAEGKMGGLVNDMHRRIGSQPGWSDESPWALWCLRVPLPSNFWNS